MKFLLTENQTIRLDEWKANQNKKAVQEQKQNPPDVPQDLLDEFWEMGYPYGGAVGGNLTYSFTPTSIGVVVTVKDAFTNETIDLTDYEDW